jgi:hypothetical protein
MKKLLPFLSIAVLMAACSPNSKESAASLAAEQQLQAYKDSIKAAADTAGLAQFQQWKAQNELMETQQYQEPEAEYAVAKTAPKAKATRKAPVRRTSQTSSVANRPAPRAEAPAPSVGSGQDVATTDGSGETAQAKKKEGWSKAAKGAVIGGAGGAVAGAVINKKNRAVGAVVGGILGAGGGYVIGRKMDKNDGRID